MNSRVIIVSVVVLFAVIAGLVYYGRLKTAEIDQMPDETPREMTTLSRIDAKHFFEDGTHYIVGEAAMQNTCDLLETNAVVLGPVAEDGEGTEMPERAMVHFDVINESEGDGVQCRETVTPRRFQVSFEAGEDVEIQALFRGEAITLNLVEAEEGETIEDSELFIKG